MEYNSYWITFTHRTLKRPAVYIVVQWYWGLTKLASWLGVKMAATAEDVLNCAICFDEFQVSYLLKVTSSEYCFLHEKNRPSCTFPLIFVFLDLFFQNLYDTFWPSGQRCQKYVHINFGKWPLVAELKIKITKSWKGNFSMKFTCNFHGKFTCKWIFTCEFM